MSIRSRSKKLGLVFDHWQICEFLGPFYGDKTAVFRLVHTDAVSMESALKVVNLLVEKGTLKEFSTERREQYERLREKQKKQAEQEVLLMNALKGRTNIVDYYDHTFVEWEEDGCCGCDMLIRMELLCDLRKEILNRNSEPFSESEILKLGKEICNALILCHRKNILHRDIKPENIFVNEDGNYKLGDFGISRIVEDIASSETLTRAGTPPYWPLEQATGRYDHRADIYSLGLVLYELSNANRLPFVKLGRTTQAEIDLRLQAEMLPPPEFASPGLKKVIEKACAKKPEERYQTAKVFLDALNGVGENAELPRFCGYCGATIDPKTGECRNPKCKSYIGKGHILPFFGKILSFLLVIALCIGMVVYIQSRDAEQIPTEIPVYTQGDTIFTKNSETTVPLTTENQALERMQMEEEILSIAEAYAQDHQYRRAIHTAEAAWSYYGMAKCYDAAARYRKEFGQYNSSVLAAGLNNTIVVNSNGTPTIVGRNDEGELAANRWSDIVAVGLGDKHVVGLKSDGTVVAAGSSKSGRCNVKGWNDVTAISAGDSHTLALRSDGSVVAVGYNEQGQCDVEKLMTAAGEKEIVAIAAGHYHSLALLEDGTVVACGNESQGAGNVTNWNNIAAIYAGELYSAGLKTDGTVVVTGNITRDWDVSQWKNIVALSAGDNFLIGLTVDNRFLSAGLGDGYVAEQHDKMHAWQDVIAIASGFDHTVVITKDGIIRCAGINNFHQGDLDGETIQLESVRLLPVSGVTVSDVLFVVSEDNSGESADIVGVDSAGNLLWSYTSEIYEPTQLSAITEIGLFGDRYYFCEDGAVIALNALTGEILWKNDDFGGRMPRWLMENGNLYLSGYLGPDFFAVDLEGKTICRIQTFDKEYCWPERLELEEGKVAVYFDIGPEYEKYESFVFHVDPENQTYRFVRNVPYN